MGGSDYTVLAFCLVLENLPVMHFLGKTGLYSTEARIELDKKSVSHHHNELEFLPVEGKAKPKLPKFDRISPSYCLLSNLD